MVIAVGDPAKVKRSIIIIIEKGGNRHGSEGIGSGMAATSGSYRGVSRTDSQERYTEYRIQAAFHRPPTGHAVRVS